MCDTQAISGWLAGAKIAYIAAMVLLGVAALNASTFFGAVGNVAVMIAAIAAVAVATAAYTAALVELNRCGGVCGAEFDDLRNCVVGLLVTMAVLTAALAAVTVVAAIPFAGAAAVVGVIGSFIPLTILVTTIVEGLFGSALAAWNRCRVSAGRTTLSDALYVLTGAAIVAGFFAGLSVAAHAPPWKG